ARLTNSPSMRKAEQWAVDKFTRWGLSNVRRDGYEFGRGWFFDTASATMIAPRRLPMRTIPVAWTPGTNGTIRGQIIVAPMKTVNDFELYRGKLAGKIVLISLPGTGDEPDKAAFQRLSRDDIAKLDKYDQGRIDPDAVDKSVATRQFEGKLDAFLKTEGAL